MSFAINFGYNKSPKETIDKDVQYPTAGQKTGILKDSTSVTDPVIIVDGISHLFTAYNYFEIPDFHRKYFITELVSYRKGLVQISGHCDILSSASAIVKLQPCIVSYAQTGFNRKINDGSFTVYQNREVINNFEFPSSFDTFDYVLALAGS